MSMGFLFTFLGKKGGIPIVERVLVDELEKSKQDYVLFCKERGRKKSVLLTSSLLANIRIIRKTVKTKHTRLVFYQFHTFPLFLTGVPYAIKVHDLYFASWTFWKECLLTTLNCIWARRIVVPSAATKNRLSAFFSRLLLGRLSNKIVVIPNPYNTAFWRAVQQQEHKKKISRSFLIVGKEDVDWLVNGVDVLNASLKEPFSVTITGSATLEQMAEMRAKHKTKLIFTGFVDDTLLAQHYLNAYAVLYRNYNEGFGYVPLEAQLCRTPILTNPDHNIKPLLGSDGTYYTNDEEYINGLRLLVKRRPRISGRAKSLKRYDPRRILGEHLELEDGI